jgi:hypothetical protein
MLQLAPVAGPVLCASTVAVTVTFPPRFTVAGAAVTTSESSWTGGLLLCPEALAGKRKSTKTAKAKTAKMTESNETGLALGKLYLIQDFITYNRIFSTIYWQICDIFHCHGKLNDPCLLLAFLTLKFLIERAGLVSACEYIAILCDPALDIAAST